MSKEKTETAKPAEFTGLRGVLWPVHNYELKKFLPMGIMMMCILFNYTILRDIKDVLVVNAPSGGAECLSFLKLYGVTPSAIIFMLIFVKLANVLERERLFYTLLMPFLIFFGAFAFVIYPFKESLHMSTESVQAWQQALPNLHWFIPVIANWSFSLFYILAELWGSVVLSMMFWQFANEITKIAEAKRFYGLFGMIGNLGLLLSGATLILCSEYAKTLPTGIDSFSVNIKFQMSAVVLAGLVIVATYRWMNKNVLTDPKLYQPGEGSGKKKKPKLSLGESFKYIISNPYLGLIAVLVLAYGVAINLVEGVWKGQIKIAFPDSNDYTAFMGQFSAWTGFITILLMVVGNNILRRLSWLKAAIITPVMVLVTSTIFFWVVWSGTTHDPFSPLLGTTVVMVAVIVGQIQNVLSKGTKYSLFDSTKQMAYIPLDQEAKTKGQAAVEVIGGRGGKSGGAFIQSTMLATIGGSVSLASLAYILGPIVIGICLIWVTAVLGLNKRFTALVEEQKQGDSKAA
jgi:AAA family ATP:ADP antiporter